MRSRAVLLPLVRLQPWELILGASIPPQAIDPFLASTHPLPMIPPCSAVPPARGPTITPTAFLGGFGTLQPWETVLLGFLSLQFPAGAHLLACSPPTPFPFPIQPNPQPAAFADTCWWAVGSDSIHFDSLDLFRYLPTAGILLVPPLVSFFFFPFPINAFRSCLNCSTALTFNSGILRARDTLEASSLAPITTTLQNSCLATICQRNLQPLPHSNPHILRQSSLA